MSLNEKASLVKLKLNVNLHNYTSENNTMFIQFVLFSLKATTKYRKQHFSFELVPVYCCLTKTLQL